MLIRDKAQKPGEKRSSSESIKGDVYSVAKGKMVRIHRIIDRRRDLYYERVHDPDTREGLHEVEESLSEHRGHGSAKAGPDQCRGVAIQTRASCSFAGPSGDGPSPTATRRPSASKAAALISRLPGPRKSLF